MPLTVLSSNRVETLQTRLVQRLVAEPLSDPFATEVIVVPTYAMSRWLNLKIARQHGIAANISYPLAGDWIWKTAASLLDDVPSADPYSSDALCWQVFELLPEAITLPGFGELRTYLDDDAGGIKRWQLAQRIAAALEKYQLYRPQQILAWSSGEENHWQAQLWRKIVASTRQQHRAEVIRRAIGRLADAAPAADLPERVSLFTMSSLAPVFIEFLHALAARTEVLMFQHNPTDQYWADLVSEKKLARQRLLNPQQAQYLDTGNSLLSSWGRQGQALQDLLLDLAPVTVAEGENHHPPGRDSLLQSVQHSLFTLSPPDAQLSADDSLSVHVCHSPMRECQVLHDYLLTMLERNPDIDCEDILVMVPEISRYAPFIEAAFQQDPGGKRPYLPWNISDISISDGHPLVNIFLQLLRLPESRFTRSDIIACLDCEEIRRCFGIDDGMLEEIHRQLERTRVHWGIDANQRRELGLPGVHENTWQQAWERLFAGYAMGTSELWRNIAPIGDIDGQGSNALALLRHLLERLVYWRQRLASAASGGAWQRRLNFLLEEFFARPGAIDDRLQPLRNAISELGQSSAQWLEPELVAYWMEQQLATTRQPGRLYSGGITFCGMRPMRNIPFPVICVLGLQESAFPRRQHGAEFDLMLDDWRPGDPHPGDEDRYLMLETLLCARRYLYYSYCGRSLKDNSECQPSVLLRELLDYIDSGAPGLSERLTLVHPMQAFSPRNFGAEFPGYDRHWYETAVRLAGREPPAPAADWWRQALDADARAGAGETVELQSLLRFFDHPVRYFYHHRLDLKFAAQLQGEDEECFSLDGLQRWALAQRLAAARLRDEPAGLEQLAAEGILPHGGAARQEWLALVGEYRGLFEGLEAYRGQAAEQRSIECRLDQGTLLVGEVEQFYPDIGLMHFSASKSVKSRSLLKLWLNHLALSAAGCLSPAENSRLLTPSSKTLRFAPLDTGAARALLGSYVELYRQGLNYPLPVFADTSYAWAAQADSVAAFNSALRAWQGGDYTGAPAGERDDDFNRLALHGNRENPIEDAQFQELARRIYAPALEQAVQDG